MTFKKLISLALFTISISISASPHQWITVFDLTEVLILTDIVTTTRTVGLRNITAYGLFTSPDYIEQRFFEFLYTLEPFHENEVVTYSSQGLRLPQLICSWIKNERTSGESLRIVRKALRDHPELCKSNTERSLFLALASMLFTPETFAYTRKLAKNAVALVKECKKHGPVYILSNCDKESTEWVKEKFPELFNEFDADKIVITGNTGIMKPDHRAYTQFLAMHNLNPAHCIVIDDRPENVEAAQKVGLCTILCPLKGGIFGKGPDLSYVQTMLMSHWAQQS
jgi:HAD superfamily hydrolase (TIGR01509 family)